MGDHRETGPYRANQSFLTYPTAVKVLHLDYASTGLVLPSHCPGTTLALPGLYRADQSLITHRTAGEAGAPRAVRD